MRCLPDRELKILMETLEDLWQQPRTISVLKYSRVTWVKCKIIFYADYTPIRLVTVKNVISFSVGVGGKTNMSWVFSVIPTALRQMDKFPGQQNQLGGGEKNCRSSHGLFSRWCGGSNMICKEIKCMEYLKLLRENYLQESGKFKSQFHRVLNRVVCNEIEFPLEFSWRKWGQCSQNWTETASVIKL